MPRLLALLLTAFATVALVTACGSGSTTKTGDAPSIPVKKIDISFSGDTVTPNGERIDVKVGQRIQFVVSADAPGEIHIHSNPEKELSYNQGTTILEVGSFSAPGIIEVESHHLEKTILQLQVQ